MKNHALKMTAIAAAFAGALCVSEASALSFNTANKTKTEIARQTAKPVRKANARPLWGINNPGFLSTETFGKKKTAVKEPETVMNGLDNYSLLDGPDGSTWFYTTEYETYEDQLSEWWTEVYITAYTFHIFDSSFKEVGTIKDKITLRDGETKVAHAVLDPAVTTTFFNTDSKPEVMVYLAMNTSAAFDYDVHYYNKVYTIGGETDEEGNDISPLTIEGRCVDSMNAAEAGQPENFYLTFVNDWYPDFGEDDTSYSEFIEMLNKAKSIVEVYAKATETDGPKAVLTKDVYLTRYPGDTTDGIYLITKSVDGQPYFIFSQYEKPYFLDPTGFAADESATPNNSLIIENMTFDGKEAKLLSSTKVPVVLRNDAGQVNYTFYSIGSVSWKNDIDMSVNGTPQNPAYLVARDYTTAAMLEDVESYYDLYANDGKLIKTIAEKAEGLNVLAPIAGTEPQALFWSKNDDEEYTFSFVNLHSGENVLTIPQVFEKEELSAACQRVSKGGGDYEYVFELQKDGVDDEGNDLKRMLWLKRDGTLDRIDSLNMGKGVQYASVNMFEGCISAYLFDTDDAVEYAILIKRTADDGMTTRNEFIVADDNGEWLARFSDDDGKGAPYNFTIMSQGEPKRLMMVYVDNDRYDVELYDLPFLKNGDGPGENETGSGVEEIIGGEESDGPIRYYNLQGIEVTNPQPGQLLIKKQGTRSSKILIK